MKKLLKSEICETHKQFTDALFTEDLVNHYGQRKGKNKKLKTRYSVKRGRGPVSKPHLSQSPITHLPMYVL